MIFAGAGFVGAGFVGAGFVGAGFAEERAVLKGSFSQPARMLGGWCWSGWISSRWGLPGRVWLEVIAI